MGKSMKQKRPKATPTRSTIIEHRLHAETTSIICPATLSGYRRTLIAVNDASRWVFVKLLRHVSKFEVSTALRQVLVEISGDANVL